MIRRYEAAAFLHKSIDDRVAFLPLPPVLLIPKGQTLGDTPIECLL